MTISINTEHLTPLNALSSENLSELLESATIAQYNNTPLFYADEPTKWIIFLIAGEIILEYTPNHRLSIKANTSAANNAIDPHQPHTATATAKGNVEILKVNADLLDLLLTWDQSSIDTEPYSQTQQKEDPSNWMSLMLQSPVFQQIPTINIPKIISAMQQKEVQTGDIIVKENDPADYYYVIIKGRCEVSRDQQKLAELSTGASFGEEAILSNSLRNATIKMLTNGKLAYLDKEKFIALIKKPLDYNLSFSDAQAFILQQNAIWIDVRLNKEFNEKHLPESINLPLGNLRDLANELLTEETVYIVYCDNGQRSTAATFILNQKGYHAYLLQSGINAIEQSKLIRLDHNHAKKNTEKLEVVQMRFTQKNKAIDKVVQNATLLEDKVTKVNSKANIEIQQLKKLQMDAKNKIGEAQKIKSQAEEMLRQAKYIEQSTDQDNEATVTEDIKKIREQYTFAKAEVIKEKEKLKQLHQKAENERQSMQVETIKVKELRKLAEQKILTAENLTSMAETTRIAASIEAKKIRLEHEDAYRKLHQETEKLHEELSKTHIKLDETTQVNQEFEKLLQEKEQYQVVSNHASNQITHAKALKNNSFRSDTETDSNSTQALAQALKLKTEATATKSIADEEINRLNSEIKQSQKVQKINSSLNNTHQMVANIKAQNEEIEQLKVDLEKTKQKEEKELDKLNFIRLNFIPLILALFTLLLAIVSFVYKSELVEVTKIIHQEIKANAKKPLVSVPINANSTPVATKKATKSRATKNLPIVDKLYSGKKGPELILIPAGRFIMGNIMNLQEKPLRTINMPAFYITTHEITFNEYNAYTQSTKKRRPKSQGWGKHNRPVINVSWDDATHYASWLSQQTNKNYRLPSETEWEYVAKSGIDKAYWWGNRDIKNISNCKNCGSLWSGKKTAPIKQFQANDFGVYDMNGNVMEWVLDCYHKNYDHAPLDNRAWLSGVCSKRMVRGGSFITLYKEIRASKRSHFLQTIKRKTIGFRLIREN